MTAPRFYSWDDDGSPGRALTGNLQNRLKQILVACLVNGYGSKPGAGWTLEHEHANGFALGNGQNYINFVSNLPAKAPYPAMSALTIHVYVAESLTEASNAVIGGANLCSGPYRSGAPEGSGFPRHMFRGYEPLDAQLSSLQWVVVADEKTVVMSFFSSAGNYTGAPFTLYFGDSINDSGLSNTFIVLGGDNVSFAGTNASYTLSKGFTSPRNLITGLAEYAITQAQPFAAYFNTFRNSNINGPIPANLNFQSPRVAVDDCYAGRLRGVVYDDVLALHGWPVYLRALGFSGADFNDRGKIVTINSQNYAYAPGYNGGFIMTDDPGFW